MTLPPHKSWAAEPEEVRQQLGRILQSPQFSGSERMCRFLRLAVEMALAGRGAELKEYLLGVEIFDRHQDYDPRLDPIVRVEARRLRAKLKAYYEGPGREDRVRIELPTGSYAPRFLPLDETRAPAPAPRRSADIAVLPFANLSGAADSDYFSDGLTEELIHALTQVPELHVVAWNTSARFKDRAAEPAAIGAELNVGSVLTGSVRMAGGRLRVAARLADTAAGVILWSEVFDRRMEDLFAVQQALAAAIVTSLRLKLLGRPAAPALASAATLQAHDLYLRARFHWNKRTREGFELGISLFEQAIAADPAFAPAHAGLADALAIQGQHGLALPGVAMPRARAAAERALELNPRMAEAYTSLGLIASLYERRWIEAEAHYRRAIELNPGYVTAHYWYGCDYLSLLGRFEEALEEIGMALRLDPLSPAVAESHGYVLMLARRYEEALVYFRRALELEPYYYKAHGAMGRVRIHQGRFDEAIEILERTRAIAGDLPAVLGALGQAYALAGRRDQATGLLRRLEEMSGQGFVPASSLALVLIGLGKHAAALDWLERGCDRKELSVSAIGIHPGYDPLRGEPRFQALLERMGLAGVVARSKT